MHLKIAIGETKSVQLKRTVGGVNFPIVEGLTWILDCGFPLPCEIHQNRDGTLSISGVKTGFAEIRVVTGGWQPENQRKLGFAVTVGTPPEALEIVEVQSP